MDTIRVHAVRRERVLQEKAPSWNRGELGSVPDFAIGSLGKLLHLSVPQVLITNVRVITSFIYAVDTHWNCSYSAGDPSLFIPSQKTALTLQNVL